MKRKTKQLFPTPFPLPVFVFGAAIFLGSAVFFPLTTCAAQNLQTSSANQTQFYGQWNPPSPSPSKTPADLPLQTESDATKNKFRELFPPAGLKPIADRSATQSARHYPLPQKPAPIAEHFPKARPLQPISEHGLLRGSFSQEPQPAGDFAHVSHHEASTAEAVMPLPKWNNKDSFKDNASWDAIAPPMSATAEIAAASPTESPSAMAGIVESMQSGSKNLWSQFQSGGGLSENIAGFFGGNENRFRKVFGSLAVVVGGYLAFVWLMRRFNLTANRRIPSEVIEVIGNAPFGPRKNLQLVRLGSKLLLLMSGPEGTHPVGEITDANEVDYLISLCNGKSTAATRSVMSAIRQLGHGTAAETRPGRTVHPTRPAPSDTRFSTAQLVQALESIESSSRSNTVFEA